MQRNGKAVRYHPEDLVIYDRVRGYLCRNWNEDAPVAGLMVVAGKYFLEAPYAHDTLEMKGEESLVINFREFDCFTFVETVAALAWTIGKGECSFENYAACLERIRYRDGISHGYPSRLHYFSDWLSDNERKGIVKDVSGDLGGKISLKNIHYMTSHREKYPSLMGGRACRKMRAVENNLSARPFRYIPKEELARHEVAVEEGDIIAATTDIEGLDIVHVGIAVRVAGKIHLLHASEIEKKVVVSEAALTEYLLNRKAATGIVVGRLIQPCRSDGNPPTV